MNKVTIVLVSIFTVYPLFLPQLHAQSNCETITTSLEKAAQKHEKLGALTAHGNYESRSRMMGNSYARNQAMELMAEAVTGYMRNHLTETLSFSSEEQQDRFAAQLLGESEQGVATIGGQQYNSSSSFVSLTLHGVREVTSNECPLKNGGSSIYYKLLAISPEGIIQTIDEAIVSFAENEEISGEALIDSWEKSALKASLLEQQKKYEKKMN
ncbi:MAG: hypothetical protein R8G66_04360 [Cytophagales bacterium]|nr:hypothetical protein [Cytophagales bacterium]